MRRRVPGGRNSAPPNMEISCNPRTPAAWETGPCGRVRGEPGNRPSELNFPPRWSGRTAPRWPSNRRPAGWPREAPPPHTWRGLVAAGAFPPIGRRGPGRGQSARAPRRVTSAGLLRFPRPASPVRFPGGSRPGVSGSLPRRFPFPGGSPSPASGRRAAVDRPVESAVDSLLSPGDNTCFPVDFADNPRKLEITGTKLLRGFPCRSTNSFTAKADVLPGGNSPGRRGDPGSRKPGNRISVAVPHRADGRRPPGSRATGGPRAARPGGAPPTHTRRGPIRVREGPGSRPLASDRMLPAVHPVLPPRPLRVPGPRRVAGPPGGRPAGRPARRPRQPRQPTGSVCGNRCSPTGPTRSCAQTAATAAFSAHDRSRWPLPPTDQKIQRQP